MTAHTGVLVVTGGLLNARDPSWFHAAQRQLRVFRDSDAPWLDVASKLQLATTVVGARRYLRSATFSSASYAPTVRRFFSLADAASTATPELTEVVLATLLHRERMPFEVTTYAELCADQRRREILLARHACVFASTRLLRDIHELRAMTAMLKRHDNRVVAGGALVSLLHASWPGVDSVDVLAVGYGEYLVGSLCDWIRSGFRSLAPPSQGRLAWQHGTPVLHSGLPAGADLDGLVAPDWSLAESVHRRRFRHVHYESVRGCPYRCAFCNYPYLFADHRFRYRSAERIAADWQQLADGGAEYVTCLDSLFTRPRRRLLALCDRLMAQGSRLQWTCYARSDDLADIGVCRLMKSAGCRQVQIGFESGSQTQLDRMNKRVHAADNLVALRNCRDAGITTLVSVIVGYPGETPATIRETFEALRASPPDVFFLAPFNVRIEHVPVLSPAQRVRFGLRTSEGASAAPYWTHDTMRCDDVVPHVAWLHEQLVDHRVALEGALFYEGMRGYAPDDRAALLDFQRDAWQHATAASMGLDLARRYAVRRLRRAVARTFDG